MPIDFAKKKVGGRKDQRFGKFARTHFSNNEGENGQQKRMRRNAHSPRQEHRPPLDGALLLQRLVPAPVPALQRPPALHDIRPTLLTGSDAQGHAPPASPPPVVAVAVPPAGGRAGRPLLVAGLARRTLA